MKSRRERWRAMLRDGVYTRIEGSLTEGNNKYCALGVACEQYRIHTGNGSWSLEPSAQGIVFRVDSIEYSENTPQTILEWYGMKEIAERLSYTIKNWMHGSDMHCLNSFLIYLNDIKKLSFNEMAVVLDIMEEPELHEMQLQELYDGFRSYKMITNGVYANKA